LLLHLVIKMDYEDKRKNILDLHFQKHLVIASSSLIILFTYFLGIGLAIITKQIDFNDLFVVINVAVISVAVVGMGLGFLYNSFYHLRNIPRVILRI